AFCAWPVPAAPPVRGVRTPILTGSARATVRTAADSRVMMRFIFLLLAGWWLGAGADRGGRGRGGPSRQARQEPGEELVEPRRRLELRGVADALPSGQLGARVGRGGGARHLLAD